MMKTEALAARLAEINPRCRVQQIPRVFAMEGVITADTPPEEKARIFGETAAAFGIAGADYVIDAIDGLTGKLDLIETAAAAGGTLFSCMGMAQKLDPTRIAVADIWDTQGCPLARLVREGLRKRGVTGHFPAVYSPERLPSREDIPVACGTGHCLCPCRDRADPGAPVEWCSTKKVINGSAVTVTATAGMILASLVLRDFSPPPPGSGNGTPA